MVLPGAELAMLSRFPAASTLPVEVQVTLPVKVVTFVDVCTRQEECE